MKRSLYVLVALLFTLNLFATGFAAPASLPEAAPAQEAAPVTVCSTCQLGVNLNLASFIPGSVLGLQIPLEGAFVGGTLAVQGFTFGVGPCLGQVALSDTALFTIR